jgi:hypothetical protein
MKQSASLTFGILKSLYPWADLDVVGEGFAATCIDEEASKGLCCDGGTHRGYAWSRHVPRVGSDVITLILLGLSSMELYYHEWKLSV